MSALSSPTLAVLAYHKIGPCPPPPQGWESWYYIREEVFRHQLQWLKDRGWRFLTLEEFLEIARTLPDSGKWPERAVLITFDDAIASLVDYALPILLEFKAPSVVFTPTHFIGGSNDFDGGAEPREKVCSWEDLKRLQEGGVAIESHSVNHPTFSSLTSQELRQECADSKSLLEERLGRIVHTLAFPFGDGSSDPQQMEEILQECGYQAAFLYKGGVIRPPMTTLYRLPRVAMGPDTDLAKSLV